MGNVQLVLLALRVVRGVVELLDAVEDAGAEGAGTLTPEQRQKLRQLRTAETELTESLTALPTASPTR